MEDRPKKPGFGALQLPAIDAKLKPGERVPDLGPLDELVLFTVRLPRREILRMKQAAHCIPGFREQDFMQRVVAAALDAYGAELKELPPPMLRELLKRNKKLQG